MLNFRANLTMTQNKNLNLMPGSGKEFADKDYWEKFFKMRGDKAFEWYGEYENLCGLIHQYIKPTEKILMVGCGNSKVTPQFSFRALLIENFL